MRLPLVGIPPEEDLRPGMAEGLEEEIAGLPGIRPIVLPRGQRMLDATIQHTQKIVQTPGARNA